MLPVKCNFKIGLSDYKCRKCDTEEEDQKHLLNCPALRDNSVLHHTDIPEYEILYGDNPKELMILGNILRTKFELLTKNQTKPSAHISQLNAMTSSAATDTNISNILSVELD